MKFFSTDWLGVWIALIAIGLSQIPPLHEFFQTAKITVKLGDQVEIQHTVGNPQFSVPISFVNAGELDGLIEKISCSAEKTDGSYFEEFVVTRYLELNELGQPVFQPIEQLSIATGQPKSLWVICERGFENVSIVSAANFAREIDLFISEERQYLDRVGKAQREIALPRDMIAEALSFMRATLPLSEGEYEFSVRVDGEDVVSGAKNQNHFSLTKPEITRLVDLERPYRFGYGIAYPFPRNHMVQVALN